MKYYYRKARDAMRDEAKKQFGFFRSIFGFVLVAALLAIPITYASNLIRFVEGEAGFPGFLLLLILAGALGVVIGNIIKLVRETKKNDEAV